MPPRTKTPGLTLKQAARQARVTAHEMNTLAICGSVKFRYTMTNRKDRFEKLINPKSLEHFLKGQKR